MTTFWELTTIRRIQLPKVAATVSSGIGGAEQCDQGVEAALGVGAGQFGRGGVGSEACRQFVEVGVELGVDEVVEDRGHLGGVQCCSAGGGDVDTVGPGDDACAAGVDVVTAVFVGAVEVGEDLPAFDDLAELVELQSVGVFQQQVE